MRPFVPPSFNIDLLWQASWFFAGDTKLRSSWSGFMESVTTGQHPGVSHITFLPIIDLSPTDDSCIYSTLVFIEQQANILNIATPCITFDQPLWLKSVEIVKAKSLKIVCSLRGFHLLVSFLGSIGAI